MRFAAKFLQRESTRAEVSREVEGLIRKCYSRNSGNDCEGFRAFIIIFRFCHSRCFSRQSAAHRFATLSHYTSISRTNPRQTNFPPSNVFTLSGCHSRIIPTHSSRVFPFCRTFVREQQS